MVQKQQDTRGKINSTCMWSVWSGQQGAGNPGPALGSGGSGFSDEWSSVAKQSANSGSFRSHSNCLEKRVVHFQPQETQNSKSEMLEKE